MTTTNGQPDRGPRPVCATDGCENLAESHSHGWCSTCRSCRRKRANERRVERVAGPLRERVAFLERMTEAGDRTISNLRAEIEAADAALKVVREERDDLRITVDRLTADRDELTWQQEMLRPALVEERKEVVRLADALAQMSAAVGWVEEERDDALTQRDEARDALDSMAERAADLMTRLRWSWGVSGVLAFGLLVIALRMWGVL